MSKYRLLAYASNRVSLSRYGSNHFTYNHVGKQANGSCNDHGTATVYVATAHGSVQRFVQQLVPAATPGQIAATSPNVSDDVNAP